TQSVRIGCVFLSATDTPRSTAVARIMSTGPRKARADDRLRETRVFLGREPGCRFTPAGLRNSVLQQRDRAQAPSGKAASSLNSRAERSGKIGHSIGNIKLEIGKTPLSPDHLGRRRSESMTIFRLAIVLLPHHRGLV